MDTALLVYYLQEGVEIAEYDLTYHNHSDAHARRCKEFIKEVTELIKELTT